MDEDLSIINSDSRNEKIKNFFVNNKNKIISGIIVLIIILLLFGKGKIPTLMGDMAKGIKSFKKNMSDEDNASASDSDKDSSNKDQ